MGLAPYFLSTAAKFHLVGGKTAYAKIVCNVRTQKEETNQTRLIFGGSNTTTEIDCVTPTANLPTVKLLINSIISTPGAKVLGLDLKDFYLNTPMNRPEFIRMKLDDFQDPEDVIVRCNLRDKVDQKGFVMVRVEKGMGGLSCAGILAQNLLAERLEYHEHWQSDKTPHFWKHDTCPINFTLIVDGVGAKYMRKEHTDHLISALKEIYVVDEDWHGKKYCGISLDWDYDKKKANLSIPGYYSKARTLSRHQSVDKVARP